MEKASIRAARASDLPELNRMNIAIHQYLAKKEGVKFSKGDLGHERIRTEDLRRTKYYVATACGSIIGLISFSKKTRNDEWFGRYVYLDEFFVDERFRGIGLGTRLFKVALAYARKKKANMRVVTTARNRNTIRLYRKFGFRVKNVEMLLTTSKS